MLVRSLGWLLLLAGVAHAAEKDRDETTLKEAGVGSDGAALLTFFRTRTMTDQDRAEILDQIGRLGHRSFSVREKASDGLRKRGPVAVPFLKEALRSKDIEVVKRVERLLADVRRGPGPEVPAAAARLLARKAPAGSAAVLVNYAPHADDEMVEEAVLDALVTLSPPKAKPDPALLAALKSDLPGRRAAAGYVLGRRAELRDAVRKLLADKSTAVRFRAAQGLLAGKDRDAVPALIALLPDAPVSQAWQAEELLCRLGGEQSPGVSLGDGSDAARAACKAAWQEWYRKYGAKADLARGVNVERLLGLTLGIEYNTGRIFECGPDGKVRWEITGLKGPMEAWVLPGNRVLVADGNTVTERDFQGKILKQIGEIASGPSGCQRLPNGNTFVSTYSMVCEIDRAGKELYKHNIGGSNAIRKHLNGNIIYTTDGFIIEMDTAGRQVRTIPLPKTSMWVGIDGFGRDRFMVANSTTGRVIEVNAEGKILWEGNVPGACGVSRLANGNTLVATSHRIVELDRKGAVVWEKKTTGYVRRVHRR
jgi:hypothetical protein